MSESDRRELSIKGIDLTNVDHRRLRRILEQIIIGKRKIGSGYDENYDENYSETYNENYDDSNYSETYTETYSDSGYNETYNDSAGRTRIKRDKTRVQR